MSSTVRSLSLSHYLQNGRFPISALKSRIKKIYAGTIVQRPERADRAFAVLS
jgi:hypothetical protein